MLTKKPMKRNLPERRRMCFIVCHVLLISACAIVAQAQNRQVVGKIRDAQGAVLPGVNVVLKGTSSGTVSDANGGYAIDIGTGDNILVFTFVGYVAQEIPLRGAGRTPRGGGGGGVSGHPGRRLANGRQNTFRNYCDRVQYATAIGCDGSSCRGRT